MNTLNMLSQTQNTLDVLTQTQHTLDMLSQRAAQDPRAPKGKRPKQVFEETQESRDLESKKCWLTWRV